MCYMKEVYSFIHLRAITMGTRMVVHGQLVEPVTYMMSSIRYCQRYKAKSLDHDI